MTAFVADAPSNIALIKYMGKRESDAGHTNHATNGSLSFTLSHLQTRVRVRFENREGERFQWQPLLDASSRWHAPELSEKGRTRFLRHAERVLDRVLSWPECQMTAEARAKIQTQTLVVESANSFPSDCGLASSASSFAALTLAVAGLLGVAAEGSTRIALANLSREGSGSSCRSLFAPWSLWDADGARGVDGLPSGQDIRHLAIVVDDTKKAVSSSEAHTRVTSSLLFKGRVERAQERLRLLLDQLSRAKGHDGVHAWNRAANLVWAESWDMHALFETSDPPFGYYTPGSVAVLNTVRGLSDRYQADAQANARIFRQPIVTMDAGPNVHVLLWSHDHAEQFSKDLRAELARHVPDAKVLS